jgi:hypothetical protein
LFVEQLQVHVARDNISRYCSIMLSEALHASAQQGAASATALTPGAVLKVGRVANSPLHLAIYRVLRKYLNLIVMIYQCFAILKFTYLCKKQ